MTENFIPYFRHEYDGDPFFCSLCGYIFGLREDQDCNDCVLESKQDAMERRALWVAERAKQ